MPKLPTQSDSPQPEAVDSNVLLADLDALSRQEKSAWLGFFAGASSKVIKWGEDSRVIFGKFECEQVDFNDVWRGKFVKLGWLTVVEVRRFKALGMVGQPESVEYQLTATEKGQDVREAYWDRLSG
ncbi:hypothetical protein JIN77_02220 [Verrucomicrobiaceae bacterium R5-34]|nr:hypothetical protein [Verrucomicrobiaceae bacterium R5-34]